MSIQGVLADLKTNPSEALESATIEFKEYSSEAALHGAKDLSDEVVAIANAGGGVIVVGVKDSSNVVWGDWATQLVGFPIIDLLEASARIRGKIKPSIDLVLENISFDEKNFLKISIPGRRESLVTTSSGKVYIRDGRSSRPMTPEEIEQAVKSLTSYDWTADIVDGHVEDMLSHEDVDEAMADFVSRRNISDVISRNGFLEAIGATRNGSVTRAGLLFFGRHDQIITRLGLIEFRFSWKTSSGALIVNEVWSSNLWRVVKKYLGFFSSCNSTRTFSFRGKSYDAPLLDAVAFHEAIMNALVHRDYSRDGMVAVDYNSSEIKISSPGGFYGGINEDNIYKHQPRHRNKALAKLMMDFNLVDRAGMGVPRMNLRSLRYGRAFPVFAQSSGFVQVTMQAEFLRPGIFVVAVDPKDELSITSLVILNSVYEIGSVKVDKILTQLFKIVDDPWSEVQRSVGALPHVEFCATRSEVLIRVNSVFRQNFEVDKSVAVSPVSARLVKLYQFLKKHGAASNSDISAHLGYKHSSQTSDFLAKTKFVRRTGSGPQAVWSLV